ncbi:glutathione S-transferase [Ceratobasidium sp. AG-Ba]|nr:glutathione S-transferase [Ceratobasidium sp. AG-Ba]
MAARKSNPIVLYDILSKQGPWSPNTYKTRLTLNYKRLPYRVEYVSIADIESRLKELGIPPSSHNPLFQYTLPNFRQLSLALTVIADPSEQPDGKPTYVVESFNIATYLDSKYPAPEYPAVFLPGTHVLQNIATGHISRTGLMPLAPIVLPYAATRSDFLDERGMEYFIRTRSAIFGAELPRLLDQAPENWKVAKIQWDKLNEAFDFNQGGPFVMGHQISFADFAFGGILHMVRNLEGGGMSCWKRIAEWHGGRWDTLWKEISKLELDSSEVPE